MFKKYFINKIVSKYVIILMATLLLSACGSGLDETYTNGWQDLKFESGGKVSLITSMMGVTNEVEAKYEVQGKKIKIILPNGTAVLTINDDGSLTGMGKAFKKKSEVKKEEKEAAAKAAADEAAAAAVEGSYTCDGPSKFKFELKRNGVGSLSQGGNTARFNYGVDGNALKTGLKINDLPLHITVSRDALISDINTMGDCIKLTKK